MLEKSNSNFFFGDRDELISGKIVLLLLVSTGTLYVFSAFSLLGYYADSSYYLFESITKKSYFLVEPSSLTVQFMQQTPLVASQYLGIENIYILSVIFGLTLLIIPLSQLALTYLILPDTKKTFFIFPLLHFLIGTQASLFPVVTDAPPAAGYFWVIFYFILFYPKTNLKLPLLFIFSLPAIYLHESMAFLSPILAIAALWNFTKEKKYLYVLLAIWFFIIAGVQLDFIINPRSASNKYGFLGQLLALKWIYWDGYNTASILGLIFVFIFILNIGAGIIRKNLSDDIINWGSVFLAVTLSLFVVLYSLIDISFYGAKTQFAARSNSALLSFPLALLVLLTLKYPELTKVWSNRNNAILLSILWVGVLGSHTVGIHQWSIYIDNFKSILTSHSGIIQHQVISKSLTTDEQKNFNKMSWYWTNPTISLLLSKDKKVNSILKNKENNTWQPFDPCNIENLSRINIFDTKPIIEFISNDDSYDGGCNFASSEIKISQSDVSFNKGFYNSEITHIWSQKESSMLLKNNGEIVNIVVSSFLPKNKIIVIINNDKKVYDLNHTQIFSVDTKEFKDDWILIKFSASLSAKPSEKDLSSRDNRELSFSIKIHEKLIKDSPKNH